MRHVRNAHICTVEVSGGEGKIFIFRGQCLTGLVAQSVMLAIDMLVQSGCTWTVCHVSSSGLRISVRTKLYDVDTHS